MSILRTAARLTQAVDELNRIEHQSGWSRVQRIAEVLREFCEYPTPNVDEALSLRRIAAHPHCPLSKTQLRDALEARRIYEEEPIVAASSFLTPSHAACVASLPSKERKLLLERAERDKIGVRELVRLVRTRRRVGGERRGRPPTSASEKAITRYDNAILSLEEALDYLEKDAVPLESRRRIQDLLGRIENLYQEALERFGEPDGKLIDTTTVEIQELAS